MMNQPDSYADLSDEQLFSRIRAARQALGDDLVILGHHYQDDAVIQFADFRGDSLELSRVAAEQKKARYIVFCGVGFMAETAAMLCESYQKVFLPAIDAPCPMALMANVEDATSAWQAAADAWGETHITPITYQNSNAELKAFCGRHGGAVCTSANAPAIFRWALDQGKAHPLLSPTNGSARTRPWHWGWRRRKSRPGSRDCPMVVPPIWPMPASSYGKATVTSIPISPSNRSPRRARNTRMRLSSFTRNARCRWCRRPI